jgi:hypothetical protein
MIEQTIYEAFGLDVGLIGILLGVLLLAIILIASIEWFFRKADSKYYSHRDQENKEQRELFLKRIDELKKESDELNTKENWQECDEAEKTYSRCKKVFWVYVPRYSKMVIDLEIQVREEYQCRWNHKKCSRFDDDKDCTGCQIPIIEISLGHVIEGEQR